MKISGISLGALALAATFLLADTPTDQTPVSGNNDKMLGVKGTALCDHQGTGSEVQLRGVNVGGWLEWQGWMVPIDSSKTLTSINPGGNGYDYGVWELLTKRFGPATTEDLINTYRDNWITMQDLDNIKALKMNVVRVGFAYDVMLHEDGTWRDAAFTRLDWLVKNAWDRGIYTVIDFHGFLPPDASQDGSANGYWSNATQMDETVQIWTRIAAHFKGNPGVAMYDLLNEPNNSSPKGRGVPSHDVVCAFYDRLYHAIRAADPDHIITMEGTWNWKTLRDPHAAGYTNVVYSFHWYHRAAKTTADQNAETDQDMSGAKQMQDLWGVPCFVSEFNFFRDVAAWKYGFDAYDKAGFSWAPWAYKDKGSGDNPMGIYTTIPGKVPPIPNLVTDSADDIRAKWKLWKTSDSFALNPLLGPVFTAEEKQ